jgi:hypothetical protein
VSSVIMDKVVEMGRLISRAIWESWWNRVVSPSWARDVTTSAKPALPTSRLGGYVIIDEHRNASPRPTSSRSPIAPNFPRSSSRDTSHAHGPPTARRMGSPNPTFITDNISNS